MASIAEKIEALYDQVDYLRGRCGECGIEVADDAKLNAIMPAIYDAYGIDAEWYLDWDFEQPISNVMMAHTSLCHVAEVLGNDLGGVFHTFRQLADMLEPIADDEPNYNGIPYAVFVNNRSTSGYDFIVDRFASAPSAGDNYKDGREIRYAYALTEDPGAEPFGAYSTPWRSQNYSVVIIEFKGWYKAYHLDYWFTCVRRLESLDMRKCVVDECVSTTGMFYLSSDIETLDISTLGDMPELQDAREMFNYAADVAEIAGIDEWHVGKSGATIDCSQIFYQCESARSLAFPKVASGASVNIASLCSFDGELESLDLSGIGVGVAVTNIQNTFRGCSKLVSIYAEAGTDWSGASSNTMTFFSCGMLVGESGTVYSDQHRNGAYARIDGLGGNPGYFSEKPDFTGTAYAVMVPDSGSKYELRFMRSTTTPQAGDTYLGKTIAYVFGGFETAVYASNSQVPWYSQHSNITSVHFDGWVRPASCAYWFYLMQSCTTIEVGRLDTSECASFAYMFYCDTALTRLDVGRLKSPQVTSIKYMFYNCTALTSLAVGAKDFTSLQDMSYAFRNLTNITALDLSGCVFGTGITSTYQTFYNCSKLVTIYAAPGTSLSYVVNSAQMFTTCTKLVGGNGTAYSSGNVNSLYARIDGENGNAGYFTAK